MFEIISYFSFSLRTLSQLSIKLHVLLIFLQISIKNSFQLKMYNFKSIYFHFPFETKKSVDNWNMFALSYTNKEEIPGKWNIFSQRRKKYISADLN